MEFKKGFSLIEIIIVTGIIGLLSSYVLVGLRTGKENARNARRLADINEIANAIDLYRASNNDDPPGDDGVEYVNGDPNWIPGLAPTYITMVPSDLFDKGEFKYHYMRQGKNYEVASFMESHGGDSACKDGGPGGCDYYEKAHGSFLAVYNPGASGWNFTSITSPPTPIPTPPPFPEPAPSPTPTPTPPPSSLPPTPEPTPPPPVDVISPVISNIQVTNITQTSAYISWKTSELSIDQFWYAKSSPLGSSLSLSKIIGTVTSTDHGVTLSNLSASTSYYFFIVSKDTAGNTATSTESSFMTLVFLPLSTKYMTVLYPNGGESFMTNQTVTLQWFWDEPNKKSATTSIWLNIREPGEIYRNILLIADKSITSMIGNNQYQWTIPDGITNNQFVFSNGITGSNFVILVSTWPSYFVNGKPASSDYSDQTFKITESSVPMVIPSNDLCSLKWSSLVASSGVSYYSAPAIASDGTIYVGSTDKNLYAFNTDGTIKWKRYLGNYYYIYSSPAVGIDGTVYIGSPDGNLYAINPDGTRKWSLGISFSGDSRSSPAIGLDGTIYIGGSNNLKAVNPDGTLKWSYATGNRIDSAPVIASDGTIYFGSIDRNFYALNPNGTKKWSYNVGSIVSAPPAIGSDGTIYVGSQQTYRNGGLYAFTPNGTKKWFFAPIDPPFTAGDTNIFYSPVIGSDGSIYISTERGNLHAVTSDGIFKWRFTASSTASQNSGIAVGSGDSIYFGYDKLYAINSTGNMLCAYPKPSASNYINSDPAVASDGTVYFGSSDGKFYAIQGTGGGLGSSSWPKFHRNLRNAGNFEN